MKGTSDQIINELKNYDLKNPERDFMKTGGYFEKDSSIYQKILMFGRKAKKLRFWTWRKKNI